LKIFDLQQSIFTHCTDAETKLLLASHIFMKRLLTSPDSAQIGLIRSRLEAAGIDCEMRNEHLSTAMPGAPFYPELWILDDAQFSEASELLAAWQQQVSGAD
jgi:hypothetical protein